MGFTPCVMKILSYTKHTAQTDKAVRLLLPTTTDTEVECWFPLSQCQFPDGDNLAIVPDWLAAGKESELGITFAEADLEEAERNEILEMWSFRSVTPNQQAEMLQIWGEKYGSR